MTSFFKEHKYAIFLTLFIIYVPTAAFWFEDTFVSWVLQAVHLTVIFMLVRYLEFQRHLLTGLNFWLIAAFLVKTWSWLQYSETSQIVANGMMFVIYALLVFHILKDILTHKVTKEIILGSLCVYMLLGTLFGTVYIQLNHILVDAFDFGRSSVSDTFEEQFNLYYYSFTTLTTVGFGDIVPKHAIAKGITTLEQMAGVLYLAVLVARLISGLTNDQRQEKLPN